MTPMMYTTSKCPSCDSPELMSVRMTLAESDTDFAFCSHCEWKGWKRQGENLALNSVLGLATVRR
jgi:hypothetical protein